MIVNEKIRDKVGTLLKEASTKFILPFYKNLSSDQINTKSSADDFVTVADRLSEVFLAENLIQVINGSNVIGEEACSDDKKKSFEFTDNRVHKGKNGEYIKHYPGFILKKDSHPDGLCLPCCFKSWDSPSQKKRRDECLNKVVEDVPTVASKIDADLAK